MRAEFDGAVGAEGHLGHPADVGDRLLEALAHRRVELAAGLRELCIRNSQRHRLCALQIQRPRVLDDGGVALGANARDDLADRLAH